LRVFEFQILESLGQGIYADVETFCDEIIADEYYQIVDAGFRKCYNNDLNSITGETLSKVNMPPLSWDKNDMRVISKITRINIDKVLAGKKLQSRKLLIDYLNLN
jgi:DNA repair protein RecO (recombination protein O)